MQLKMLNTGKGPAVHSLRAQADKRRYHERMKRALEQTEHLYLRQGEAVRIETKQAENGKNQGLGGGHRNGRSLPNQGPSLSPRGSI